MKGLYIIIFSVSLIFGMSDCYADSIPFLLYNKGKKNLYIYDQIVRDTIKVQTFVKVTFDDSLRKRKDSYAACSVDLLKLRYGNQDSTMAFITEYDEKNIYEQYIWNMVNSKLHYWYMLQPYTELFEKNKGIKNPLYMTAVFLIVPF